MKWIVCFHVLYINLLSHHLCQICGFHYDLCVLRKERKERPSVGHLCSENSTDRGVWWATVSSWGHKESDMTEQPNPCMPARTHTHTHTHTQSLFLHRGSGRCFGNKRGRQRLDQEMRNEWEKQGNLHLSLSPGVIDIRRVKRQKGA